MMRDGLVPWTVAVSSIKSHSAVPKPTLRLAQVLVLSRVAHAVRCSGKPVEHSPPLPAAFLGQSKFEHLPETA